MLDSESSTAFTQKLTSTGTGKCIQVCNALIQFHSGVSPSQPFKLENFSNIADILGILRKSL